MAKSDRVLTLVEILEGNVTEEYLDIKERKVIIGRHMSRLDDRRFDLEDKIDIVGETDELIKERQKLTNKIDKLEKEYQNLRGG